MTVDPAIAHGDNGTDTDRLQTNGRETRIMNLSHRPTPFQTHTLNYIYTHTHTHTNYKARTVLAASLLSYRRADYRRMEDEHEEDIDQGSIP